MEAKKGESWGSLRASSPIWASEASLARTRERAAKRGSFAYPNRRACSQANIGLCHGVFTDGFIFRYILQQFFSAKLEAPFVDNHIRSIYYDEGEQNVIKV